VYNIGAGNPDGHGKQRREAHAGVTNAETSITHFESSDTTVGACSDPKR